MVKKHKKALSAKKGGTDLILQLLWRIKFLKDNNTQLAKQLAKKAAEAREVEVLRFLYDSLRLDSVIFVKTMNIYNCNIEALIKEASYLRVSGKIKKVTNDANDLITAYTKLLSCTPDETRSEDLFFRDLKALSKVKINVLETVNESDEIPSASNVKNTSASNSCNTSAAAKAAVETRIITESESSSEEEPFFTRREASKSSLSSTQTQNSQNVVPLSIKSTEEKYEDFVKAANSRAGKLSRPRGSKDRSSLKDSSENLQKKGPRKPGLQFMPEDSSKPGSSGRSDDSSKLGSRGRSDDSSKQGSRKYDSHYMANDLLKLILRKPDLQDISDYALNLEPRTFNDIPDNLLKLDPRRSDLEKKSSGSRKLGPATPSWEDVLDDLRRQQPTKPVSDFRTRTLNFPPLRTKEMLTFRSKLSSLSSKGTKPVSSETRVPFLPPIVRKGSVTLARANSRTFNDLTPKTKNVKTPQLSDLVSVTPAGRVDRFKREEKKRIMSDAMSPRTTTKFSNYAAWLQEPNKNYYSRF